MAFTLLAALLPLLVALGVAARHDW